MAIDFHHEQNRFSYTNREVDSSWLEEMNTILEAYAPQHVVDLGCGGGIYSRVLAEMGVSNVTGVDSSKTMIQTAEEEASSSKAVTYQVGSATEMNLSSNAADMVFARALIHHLKDLAPAFEEGNRVLKRDGLYLIQTRTPEDCFLPGSAEHLRGYFFHCYPHLKEIETRRRHPVKVIHSGLQGAGFQIEKTWHLWETRAVHETKQQFLDDIRLRKGRSLLHDLSDQQLETLVAYLDRTIQGEKNIVEKDRWTLILAKKQYKSLT
ncbi:class I SAM-dependent methyltransferase [Bacillus sp. Marseille-P3800]|uniref:class I SAM-dependent methyltransferase n=1 Tax=Bacillus sp. Marseille-P3800 TaxID=2014782 RepID=UPI000C06A8D4|nr:class I SAM-dependent methyltransferase [Bacillus sp. Marseille-P3800]